MWKVNISKIYRKQSLNFSKPTIYWGLLPFDVHLQFKVGTYLKFEELDICIGILLYISLFKTIQRCVYIHYLKPFESVKSESLYLPELYVKILSLYWLSTFTEAPQSIKLNLRNVQKYKIYPYTLLANTFLPYN